MTEPTPAGSAHGDQISPFADEWKKQSGSLYLKSFSVQSVAKAEEEKKHTKRNLKRHRVMMFSSICYSSTHLLLKDIFL